MLDQGGVSMLFELFEELLLVKRGDTWRTSRRPPGLMQRPQTLLFQVGIHSGEVDAVQPCDGLFGMACLDRSHDPFPQV